MTTRMKRLAALLVLGLAVATPTSALAGHKQGPGCHGQNQVECRPDPQPTHGNDCGDNSTYPLNSNDHCGNEEIPV